MSVIPAREPAAEIRAPLPASITPATAARLGGGSAAGVANTAVLISLDYSSPVLLAVLPLCLLYNAKLYPMTIV